MYKSERYYVPIHEKANLTLDEAAAYLNANGLKKVMTISRNTSLIQNHIVSLRK